MREKILLLGSSITCALGMCLVVLALVSVAVEIAHASQTEIYIAGDDCRNKGSDNNCGANDCPPRAPNCHLLMSNDCDCRRQ
jgi:hypothetical protein